MDGGMGKKKIREITHLIVYRTEVEMGSSDKEGEEMIKN
jgi:hypothetical protein